MRFSKISENAREFLKLFISSETMSSEII
jgi:hypothetical protein